MRIRVTPEDRVLQWAATADVKDVERVLGSVRNILTARKPKRKRTLKVRIPETSGQKRFKDISEAETLKDIIA